MRFTIKPALPLLFGLLSCSVLAQLSGSEFSVGDTLTSRQLLPVEQAFRPQALIDGDSMRVVWSIESGYYLYRKQFRVFGDGVELRDIRLAEGESTYDPFFDEELEIYRDETEVSFPVDRQTESITLRFQGCADAGYCYPPSWAAFEPGADGGSVRYLGLVTGPPGSPAAPAAATPRSSIGLYAAIGTGILLILGLLGWLFYPRRPSISRD